MSRVLVLYGTTDGHTAKVASVVASTLRTQGCEVDVFSAAGHRRPVVPGPYDGVIVTASVHRGDFQPAVRRWVTTHAAELSRRPTAFMPVCLAVIERRPEARVEVNQTVEHFLSLSGWRPGAVRLVAGAVPYTRYGWLKKRIMRHINAKAGGGTDITRDYEYTDWNDVQAFARDFAVARRPAAPAAEPAMSPA